MFISTINNILSVLGVVLALYGLYYVVVSLFGLKRPKAYAPCAPRSRFAVLVAARNEEAVIGNLVDSLLAQNYPRELYDIYVLPNNCTDNTRRAAIHAGAKVLDCTVPVRSKGQVLSFAFDCLLKDGNYDAFCVFDADNLVHPDFLSSMNNALCSGVRLAQGYRDSKNPADSAIATCYSIYFWMIDRFYNQGRANLGLSCALNGCGFMVHADVIRSMGGYHTHTLTEDSEFTLQCVLCGVRAAWVPGAVFFDEQPLTFRESWKQRKRWTSGLFECTPRYLGALIRRFLTQRDMTCLDLAIYLLSPVFQVLCCLSLLFSGALNLLYLNYRVFPAAVVGLNMFLSLDFSYLVAVFSALSVLVVERKYRASYLSGVAMYWLFVMSWIPLTIYCLISPTRSWDEIRHTCGISLKELKSIR